MGNIYDELKHTRPAGGGPAPRFLRSHPWTALLNPQAMSALCRRWEKALPLVDCHVVAHGQPDIFHVTGSQGRTYNVILNSGCTCPDRAAPFGWCKHRLAAWLYREQLHHHQAQAVDLDRQRNGW